MVSSIVDSLSALNPTLKKDVRSFSVPLSGINSCDGATSLMAEQVSLQDQSSSQKRRDTVSPVPGQKRKRIAGKFHICMIGSLC